RRNPDFCLSLPDLSLRRPRERQKLRNSSDPKHREERRAICHTEGPAGSHMFRILALEPDPERGRALQRMVQDRVGADVVLASSTPAAIAAIKEQVPDLVLASALLTPSDDAQLTAYLKEQPEASDLTILTIPPVIDADPTPSTRGLWLPGRFRRRGA